MEVLAGLPPLEASLLGVQTASGTPSRACVANAAPALSQDAGSRSAVHCDQVELSGPRPSFHPASVCHLLHLLHVPQLCLSPRERTHTCWAERGGPPGPHHLATDHQPSGGCLPAKVPGEPAVRTPRGPQWEGHLTWKSQRHGHPQSAPSAHERGGALQAEEERRPRAGVLTPADQPPVPPGRADEDMVQCSRRCSPPADSVHPSLCTRSHGTHRGLTSPGTRKGTGPGGSP